MSPGARAWAAVALVAAVPAVVIGAVLVAVVGPVAGLIALVVVGAAVASWARLAGDRRVAVAIGGRDADPDQDARLLNLVEGLSVGAGIRQPRLRVVAAPGLNAMAAGTRPDQAFVAVTDGLLEELSRMELEAVLAEQVAKIRRGETLPDTVLVATFGLTRRVALTRDRDAQVDLAAVGITRYPPALVAALEKVEAKGAAVPGQPKYMAHLWLADPAGPGAEASTTMALSDRIEALREL